MIRLRFTGVAQPHGVFLGPAPWFRIAGGSIHQGPDGELVGRIHDQQWIVRGSAFNRFDCRHPVMLRLEDSTGLDSEEIGQFEECAAVGGALLAEGVIVASWAPEKGLWLSAETEGSWRGLLIEARDPKRGYPRRY